MPIPDHASLNVPMTITGLSADEMTTVVTNLPATATCSVIAHPMPPGAKRFEVDVEGLSVEGARSLLGALAEHLDQVAEGQPWHPAERLLNDIAYTLESGSDATLRDALRHQIKQAGYGEEGRRLAAPITAAREARESRTSTVAMGPHRFKPIPYSDMAGPVLGEVCGHTIEDSRGTSWLCAQRDSSSLHEVDEGDTEANPPAST